MGVFDRVERGIENAMSSVFSRAFHSEVKATEIASAIRKEMASRAAAISRSRTVAPNEFTVVLSESDFQRVMEFGEETLAAEFIADATTYAAEQGYTFTGPVMVHFASEGETPTGKLVIHATTRDGNVAPATTGASDQNPVISVEGEGYLLTGPVTIIGRGSDADVVIEDSGVSRHHLELRMTPDGVIATDLNSTNGTYVEGNRISAALLQDGNAITIGRTQIMFWTGAAED